jgi:hypothetical protein
LRLLSGDALADDLTSTGIPLADEDDATTELVEYVESSLQSCHEFKQFETLGPISTTAEVVDQLGTHGFNPAFYRKMPDKVKRAFLRKLLVPKVEGDWQHQRRLSAQLICEQSIRTCLEALTSCVPAGIRVCSQMESH